MHINTTAAWELEKVKAAKFSNYFSHRTTQKWKFPGQALFQVVSCFKLFVKNILHRQYDN